MVGMVVPIAWLEWLVYVIPTMVGICYSYTNYGWYNHIMVGMVVTIAWLEWMVYVIPTMVGICYSYTNCSPLLFCMEFFS